MHTHIHPSENFFVQESQIRNLINLSSCSVLPAVVDGCFSLLHLHQLYCPVRCQQLLTAASVSLQLATGTGQHNWRCWRLRQQLAGLANSWEHSRQRPHFLPHYTESLTSSFSSAHRLVDKLTRPVQHGIGTCACASVT